MATADRREHIIYYTIYSVVALLGLTLLLVFGGDPPGPAGWLFLGAAAVSALVYSLTGVNVLGRGGSSGGGGAP
ncbi:hypothetical protein RIF23_01755 [Lipingzhangella sp. LS1_29]|uniref:Uncharacterized protein n=1 Tax=Lipingzhangella rawalii TaxID=2055835 RepID=A0ABU2H301_9ACTN|nr:hypothetical protein [Lipingzhangella rawalii]MDS1269014.1 hypothetical protein [Lipingzhangella rawalii]